VNTFENVTFLATDVVLVSRDTSLELHKSMPRLLPFFFPENIFSTFMPEHLLQGL